MSAAVSSYNLFLSLGSNLGNRFENLQVAIDRLFEEIGSVLKISSVYETPALGFEGEPFLNCVVLMQTEVSPMKVLETVLEIERKMGRERTATEGYASRNIDIDILFAGNQVIQEDGLTVPHPRIENRKFVLQPLCDIDAAFVHPVLNKTVQELLKTTSDESQIAKQAKWLKNPMSRYDFSRYNYIAIEGNIGAGKTSLSTKISEDFNAKLILERFRDNPFLPKFYDDPSRYAFPLEMSFLADRYQQLVDDITQFDLFKEWIIADYDVNKSLIFASITLPEDEFALYRKLFHVMHKDLPKPDLYIYLYQSTERLLENIKKRGREYERSIRADYLQKLNEGYSEFIKNLPAGKTKIIDISEIDFVENRKDYLYMLDSILK